jgi:cellulase/cellobiase CelA1
VRKGDPDSEGRPSDQRLVATNPGGAVLGPVLGAVLGVLPGTVAGHRGVDALPWLTHPGESDRSGAGGRQGAGRFDAAAARPVSHARRQ